MVVVDGETSTDELVKSGVPQGTLLGPLLFLLYINDISRNTSATIHLFADDRLIHRKVDNLDDAQLLKENLDILTEMLD